MDCVFCAIVNETEPATVVEEWSESIAFIPINPVAPGHTLVIPKIHVKDALEDPFITAITMERASEFTSARWENANILTSVGRPATQSIFHLHIHVVPRKENDSLMLPWGTTGDPHKPHWCKVAEEQQAAVAQWKRHQS